MEGEQQFRTVIEYESGKVFRPAMDRAGATALMAAVQAAEDSDGVIDCWIETRTVPDWERVGG